MTKHLHNLLTATGILMLCLFAALPARAYTALDLIPGSEKICGVEAVHGNYAQRSLTLWSHGITAAVNKDNTNQIILFGVFEGMANIAFNIVEENGNTYAYLVTNSYGYQYVPVNDGITTTMMPNRSLMFTGEDAARVTFTPCSVDIYGNYYTEDDWKGTVTKSNDGRVTITFDNPIGLRYRDASGYYLFRGYLFFNKYQVVLDNQTNVNISDTYIRSDLSSYNRNYKARINFLSGNRFNFTNWAGFGEGIQSTKTNSNPNVAQSLYCMEGYYVPETGKVYMKRAPWMVDADDVDENTSNVYNAMRRFEMRQVEDPTVTTVTTYATGDIEGTIDFNSISHADENDLWQAPHGNLKTTTAVTMKFEPFVAFSVEKKAILPFRINNTVIKMNEEDVTLNLKLASMQLKPGTTNTEVLPINADIAFYADKNETFVHSYDIYLVEGESPKGEKTIYLGNVVAKDIDEQGYHKLSTNFKLTSPDGKPWYTHKDEAFNYLYSLKIVAHYVLPTSAAPANGKRMAITSLAPSNHGLGNSTLSFTVGVNGVNAESNLTLENTQNGVIVHAPSDMAVEVYNMAGVKVAQGVANSEITFDGKGVFVVKAGAKVFKVIK